MNGDFDQRLKNVEEKLEKIHKDVKNIKWQLVWGTVFNILVIVIPLILLIYFLPKILNNFLAAYLPQGSDVNIQQEFQKLLQGR